VLVVHEVVEVDQCGAEEEVLEVLQEGEEASVPVVEVAVVVVVGFRGEEAVVVLHPEEGAVQEAASQEVVVRSVCYSVCRYHGVLGNL